MDLDGFGPYIRARPGAFDVNFAEPFFAVSEDLRAQGYEKGYTCQDGHNSTITVYYDQVFHQWAPTTSEKAP